MSIEFQSERADMATKGFCVIKDVLSAQEVAILRDRIEEQAIAEVKKGVAFNDGISYQDLLDESGQFKSKRAGAGLGGVNQRIFMLINKGECLRKLVTHPVVNTLVSHVLGDDYILSSYSANIVRKGSPRMGLHTDQWWAPQPVERNYNHFRPANISRKPADEFINPNPDLGIAPPVTVTAVWMLTHFGVDNGTTEIVPGTHLSGSYPTLDAQEKYSIIQPEAPAGSLLIFDGRVWHGNGASVSDVDRIGLLATFCAPQYRQQENMTLGLDRELWSTMSDDLKRRLGFKVWNAYGRVEADFGELIDPDVKSYGELKLDKDGNVF